MNLLIIPVNSGRVSGAMIEDVYGSSRSSLMDTRIEAYCNEY